ncbi:MAG: 3'-to-5' exoribonuclease RNase R [Rhodanobacteraceae bacterium]|jgi:exoribonuclease R|nr:MAG: 3'-to-5' exoribonuclease RNase R [Rhodanobacteraceae bacterium]
MPITRRLRINAPADPVLEQGLTDIRKKMHLPNAFPPEVEAAARDAAANLKLPDLDRTDIPLVTIDPPGSMDLDQAMYIERNGDGWRVYYAIADVASFVAPGGALDVEANHRGETLYGIGHTIPLHPAVLSEGAASLLPGQLRPALLWTIELDADGASTSAKVERARVKSRKQCDYDSVQADIDAGRADPMWALLKDVGELRRQRAQRLGAISLPLPEQEATQVDGHWTLAYRARHPVEDWNEQISLLTGMAAAGIMLKGKVGVLRTLPQPDPEAIAHLRQTAANLKLPWPPERAYPAFIDALDPADPAQVAMLVACTRVLRGAGYTSFHGAPPAQPMQSALAAEYTHATAPLRRLVDRYAGEICVALCAGETPPDWALAKLDALPDTMRVADRTAGDFEHATIGLLEAVVLTPRVGDSFPAIVTNLEDGDARTGTVMIDDPAIETRVHADHDLPLGQRVTVKLLEADPATRQIRFELE